LLILCKVKSISEASYSSGWSLKSSRGTIGYKAIILAAPFHSSDITVPPSISEQIPEQPYMHLHVTILSTTAAHPNPKYFSIPAGSKVPRVMLTTKERSDSPTPPEFISLTYHGRIREEEWAVKIFSNHRISDEWLDNMFQGQVKWVTRKEVSRQRTIRSNSRHN
jgi:prenylcysteine oxidase/farnesylcysteine lyase